MQQYLFLDNIYIYFLNIWLPFPILLSFSYHPKMMRSSYLELLCHADQFTIFESIGLIHLDQLHPTSGLLP